MVWLWVGFSAAAWGWRAWGHGGFEPLPPPAFELSQPDTGHMALALGGGHRTDQAAVTAPVGGPSVPIRLTGVIRDGQGQGVALMRVADQPEWPYRIGALVTDQWKLVRIGAEGAEVASVQQDDVRRVIPLE